MLMPKYERSSHLGINLSAEVCPMVCNGAILKLPDSIGKLADNFAPLTTPALSDTPPSVTKLLATPMGPMGSNATLKTSPYKW